MQVLKTNSSAFAPYIKWLDADDNSFVNQFIDNSISLFYLITNNIHFHILGVHQIIRFLDFIQQVFTLNYEILSSHK